MSELARLFYARLLELLRIGPDTRTNYRALAVHFRPEWRLSWRGGPMHQALGELVRWCRDRGLGLLPAIVVRADTGIPGDGFFEVAFPGVRDQRERRRLWRAEIERIRRSSKWGPACALGGTHRPV
jgi:hypothetical protein